MAITKESQIFDASSTKKATAKLDEVVSRLNAAKESLKNAKKFCGKNVFEINGKNTFPDNIDKIISQIEVTITKCQSYKTNVNVKADAIALADKKEYQAYLEQQAAKAADTASTNKSGTVTVSGRERTSNARAAHVR